MKSALYSDKNLIVEILTASFDENQSVNYIVKQDNRRTQRIRSLMDYSFEICFNFGEVFLSDDKNACALVLYPDKKKTTLKSILLDVKLILKSIGIANISKALSREAKIKQKQLKEKMYYLWFIGVKPDAQNSGVGSQLLNEIHNHRKKKNRPVVLETSTVKNLPWYQKFGFNIYDTLDLGYTLHFLKNWINR